MVSQLYLSSPLHSNDGDFQSKSKHTNIIVTLIEIHFNPACEKNALYIKKRFHFLRACALYKKVISFSSRSVSMKNHFRILKWFFICKVAFRNRNHFFISHRFQETRITFLYSTCFPKPELLFISHRSHETEITFCFPLGCEESEVLSSVSNPFRLNFRRLFLEFRFNESIGFVFSFVDYIYFEGFRIAEYIEIMS